MSSGDSDDEPLSTIATGKSIPKSPEKIINKPKRRKKQSEMLLDKVKLKELLTPAEQVERPNDVWLYYKDFNKNGPYSCLLCKEWFLNKSRMVMHYLLNHEKDFCGICNYFVPDREVWQVHIKYHSPWKCTQCDELYEEDSQLQQHYIHQHNMVHCRLCHFMTPLGEMYDEHLSKNHNVTVALHIFDDRLWEYEYKGHALFTCNICAKNIKSADFLNHYFSIHHITLKCFAKLCAGREPDFAVYGLNLTEEFHMSTLKNRQCGYVGMVDIKEEFLEKSDNFPIECVPDSLCIPELQEQNTEMTVTKIEEPIKYPGIVDFDVTSTEIVVAQIYYYEYINWILHDLKTNNVPPLSQLKLPTSKCDLDNPRNCPYCAVFVKSVPELLTHVNQMHNVVVQKLYNCRICYKNFDNNQDLLDHMMKKMMDFKKLWLCQFCDQEFKNRAETRKHLSEHFNCLQSNNCFSPHLGFMCRYCPTLFWNEPDREVHQKAAHFDDEHRGDFYKCSECSDTFSDQIWFTYHYIGSHCTDNVPGVQIMYKCTVCCLVLNSVQDLRNHFDEAHPTVKLTYCSIGSCNFKPFKTDEDFQSHLVKFHGPKASRSRSCMYCGGEFPTIRECNSHIARAHRKKSFQCKICSDHVFTTDERNLHYMLCHPGRYPFECNICGKSFLHKSTLYTHKAQHVANTETYTCEQCEKVFTRRETYREHLAIHEGPRHTCSYCPAVFVQRSNMIRHERRHTGERPYTCRYCGRTFADRGAQKSHERTHSRELFQCQYCSQTFLQKSKLTYHTRRHTGENLEKCELCQKTFTNQYSLREHMKTHDRAKARVDQRYLEKCELCAKIFTSQYSLREHKKTHAKKNTNDNVCPVCNKWFRRKKLMFQHLKRVHQEAYLACPVCARAHSNFRALKAHVRTHCKEKNFRCKLCVYSCASIRSVISHVKTHHSKQVKASKGQIKSFYDKLDVRDCGLDLDEETIIRIFGKKQDPDESPSNDSAGTDTDTDEMNDGETEYEIEIQPIDFVAVKIEPCDDDYELAEG